MEKRSRENKNANWGRIFEKEGWKKERRRRPLSPGVKLPGDGDGVAGLAAWETGLPSIFSEEMEELRRRRRRRAIATQLCNFFDSPSLHSYRVGRTAAARKRKIGAKSKGRLIATRAGQNSDRGGRSSQ